MKHYIFISYSSHDKVIADAICAKLENNNIRCWIAPRDILPGIEFGEAIVDAIADCRIFLLVFSSKANDSTHVRKEVDRAVSKGKIIIPFRVEDVLPTKSMEYALSNTHWLDAMYPPLDIHIAKLSDTIYRLLDLKPKNSSPENKKEKEKVENQEIIIKNDDEAQQTSLSGPPPEVYAPIVGTLITDSTNTKTKLIDFGIVYNPYSKSILANAVKDYLIIERGNATQNIPWNLISFVTLKSKDDATIALRDGKLLDPVKLRSGNFVGTDELGLAYSLEFANLRAINLLRDTALSELETLIRDIPVLAKKTLSNSAYSCNFRLDPDNEGIIVTLDVIFDNKLQGSQIFHLPGPHKFSADNNIVKVEAEKYFNLGNYSEGTAQTLAFALNRLNTLLLEKTS